MGFFGARHAVKSPPLPQRKSTTLRRLFDLDSQLDALSPAAPSADADTKQLLSAISYCTTAVFNFVDPAESPAQQDLKRRQLSHVLSAVRETKAPFFLDEAVWPPLLAMLAANLFRPLPAPAHPCLPPDLLDEDGGGWTMALAPDWPHLHVAYDILSAAVAEADERTLRRHIDRGFLRGLLALFQSEDPRERDRLKVVYHQLYSKLAPDRGFMRRQMVCELAHQVFDAEPRPCGAAELLEIWGSIICGFAVPLKEEHRVFLSRVLVPLHKAKCVAAYHRQLAYCVTLFVAKEPELGEVVVKGILRHWPATNCHKEVLLLEELEELVESLDVGDLQKVAVPICNRVARCSGSTNSQVAERALCMWNNEQFVKMASQCWEEVLPSIVEAVEKNLEWHWSKSVQELAASLKRMLEEAEPVLYSRFLLQLQRKEADMAEEERKRKMRWERLEMATAKL
ncbi:serine/threonine protein phosphatase 2A 57 kDa regulatory subunit B' alpha isoform-like isoform X1 [Curcuma longa]|uniref:serine/threonine protein phosphatase 2A 57 kDa regulatory subunit B' alpha isoform-like isoform X1 n=1 Tax=Curcuma longa TaxID=136217 RepID=UPI003D9ED4B8